MRDNDDDTKYKGERRGRAGGEGRRGEENAGGRGNAGGEGEMQVRSENAGRRRKQADADKKE